MASALLPLKSEQRVLRIAGVPVGGVPGRRPTVLVGSIFYRGHRIVDDDVKGVFDRGEAERLINVQDELSDKTGNPCMVEVVASTPEAMVRYLDFTASVTEAPILLGGVDAASRTAGVRYAAEVGLLDRCVYNSVSGVSKEAEIKSLSELGVENVVVLAYGPRAVTSSDRFRLVEELLGKVQEAGVRNVLVDTCVLDVPSLGIACKTVMAVKSELGLPAGCGAHNAVGTWRGLREKFGRRAVRPASVAACVAAASAGADFILYGPMRHAKVVFPAVAMVDAAYGQVEMEGGFIPGRGHPLFRIG